MEGATENASTEKVSTGDGIRKYGKPKYELQGWKMQVWKTQVQICRGGKRKYGNGKSDLNADVTEKYHCQSITERPRYWEGIIHNKAARLIVLTVI